MKLKLMYLLPLAAWLLMGMPSQAQELARKQTGQKMLKAHRQPSPLLTSPQEEQQKLRSAEAIPFGRAQKETAHRSATPKAKQPETEQNARRTLLNKSVGKPKKLSGATGEVVDEHGIIISPADGVRKVYARSGRTFMNDIDTGLTETDQSGYVQIVECPDGIVYIRNIISSFGSGSWVKGFREGNTITVPTHQPLLYRYEETVSARWGMYEEEWGGMFSNYDDYAENFTFTVDDDAQTITLEGSTKNVFMGAFWDSDQSFAWSGDYATVWTYDHDYAAMQTTTVTPPPGLATETWYTKGHLIVDEKLVALRGTVTIGFDGDDIYLQGLFEDYPEAWMKGTIDGTEVTFSDLQLIGQTDDSPVYAVGTDGSDLTHFVMTWDADAKQLTSVNGLLANADEQDISALVWLNDIAILHDDPYKPIDELPYTNSFDTREEWEQFTVINANGDDRTWANIDQTARYHYDSDNAADDWLISPAFVLKAGTNYHFAIDTYNQNYDERLEVKIGQAPTAEAMTTEVIAPTDIVWTEAQTLENSELSVSADGIYYIGIHAISDPDMNALHVDNFLLEDIIPEAPAAPTLTVAPDAEKLEATVSVTAPTTNIAGGQLDENLTKIEVLRDGLLVHTFTDVAPGSTLSFTDSEGLTVGYHTWQAIAYNAFGTGGKSEKVTAYTIMVLEVPYTADFTDEETFNQFTAIDGNDDYFCWVWDPNDHAYYSAQAENSADDYLVSLPVKMEGGKAYDITVMASTGSARLPERFEVLAGKEPTADALTYTIIEPLEVNNLATEPFEGTFTPEEDGNYYIAIHCISVPDMFELRIHELSIAFGAAPTAPAAPTLVVTPGPLGALTAEVSVTAPTTTADGQPLTGALTAVEVYRGDDLVATEANVAPGATFSLTDEVPASGTYTYRAIPYNDSGIGKKSERVSAFIGMDAPTDITALTLTDNLSTVGMHWEKVGTAGQHGGYVDPAQVDYRVYGSTREDGFINMSEDPIDVVTDADSFEAPFNTEEGDQEFAAWGVQAANESGETLIRLGYLLTGESYALPVVEGFANSTFHYFWESNGQLLTTSDATDGDGIAAGMVSAQAGETHLTTGKIYIKDAANPTLVFDVAGHGISTINILGSVNQDGNERQLASADVSETFTMVKVPLKSLSDGHYVRLSLSADYTNPSVFNEWDELEEVGDFLIIDNIRIVDLYAHDLSTHVEAPASMKVGATATITATVRNEGENAASDYTVTICLGEEELLKETVSTPLAPFSERQFTASYTPTVFDQGTDKAVTATVVYANDQQPANNNAETTLTVKESLVPAPENLVVADKGGSVELSWDAPSSSTMLVTEEFEDGLGDFTTIDADGDGNGWTYHNNATSQSLYHTQSGDGCVYSESYSNMTGALTPDNWLVSQLAVLDGTFSFWAVGQDEAWCDEHFAVFVSTTSATDPEAFTQVSEEFVATSMMTEYSVDLSAFAGQTGYIAIRHFNVTDQFSLVIDDVTYTMTSGSPTAYNIYLGRDLMGTVKDGVTTFTIDFDGLSDGEYEFSVTAVYADGQESRPITVKATIVNGIDTVVAAGRPADVHTLDGRLVRRQATTLEGLHGVYVVKGKTIVVR